MSSQGDSLASHSVMPGSEEARMMTVTSGRSLSELSPKSDPLGSLVKMLLASPRWSSRARLFRWQAKPLCSMRATEYEDTETNNPSPSNGSATILRVWDMPSNRLLFQLVPLELPTNETECSSLLKTPCAWDYMELKSWDTSRDRGTLGQQAMMGKLGMLPTPMSQGLKVCDENGQTKFMDLSLLPTPTAIEGEKYTNTWNPNSQMGQSLSAMAGSGLLPIPNACDYNTTWSEDAKKECLEMRTKEGKTAYPSKFNALKQLARENLLPTPRAKGEEAYETRAERKGHETAMTYLESAVDYLTKSENDGQTSRLSPLFTQEMMGFPFGWTELPFLSQNGEMNP